MCTFEGTNSAVYLALGSNLGDRCGHLAAAIRALAPQVIVEQVSSLYETEPAYVTDQPRFLNMALHGRTALDPLALLAWLKEIERTVGRAETVRFGPRVIDLDILLYADLAIDTPELTIPHPRMVERPFVLAPLAEIAPDLVPPGWNNTIGELAARVHGHGDVVAIAGRLY